MSTNSPQTPQVPLRPRRAGRRLPLALTVVAVVFAVAAVATTGLAGEDGAARATRDWREVTARVDALILERLRAEGVEPAPLADDSEFLRRLYLDLLGTVPTPEEVTAFLADKARDKRAGKIDELMASDAYAENQASFWFRTLTGLSVHQNRVREGQGGRYLAGEGGQKFHEWLSTQIAANRPYDEMVEDLITATGRTDENGAAGYLARWESDANNTAGAIAKHFLGVQIQCAQCHDHVYEPDWKQKDFQGMAAFFALTSVRRVPEYRELQKLRQDMQKDGKGRKGDGAKAGEPGRPGGDGMEGMPGEMREKLKDLAKYRNIVEVRDAAIDPRYAGRMASRLEKAKNEELRVRARLVSTTPKFWMGPEAADLPGVSRRYLLARWVTSDDNPYFARALANRLWGTYMGRGIVNPIDDFNSFQAPSHPRVLALLAEDFKTNGYDLRRIERILLNSATYQRTSRWTGEKQPEAALFAKAPVRPLGTEQLYFSLVRATGMETRLNRVSRRAGQDVQRGIFSAFTFVFDDDEGKAEEDFSGSIPQGLFLMNGELLQRAIGGGRPDASPPRGRAGRAGRAQARQRPAQSMLEELVRGERSPAKIVDQLYLRAFAREPDASERREAVHFLEAGKESPQAYEDLFWALLNSAEFMTNH